MTPLSYHSSNLSLIALETMRLLVQILKENADFFAEHICRQFNEAICSSKFPATFKFANVTPVFKNGNRNQKDNYRPMSILPIISKIFEKLICRQPSNHFDNIFSKFQCSFRKDFKCGTLSPFNDRQMEKST